MTVPMKQPDTSDIMETVLLKGDLAKLTPDERVSYYNAVCKSLGLNPLTQPFAYITLNNKLQLYALRACADQLRKVNSVSLEIVSQEVANDILTVRVRATLPDGRRDEDLGTVFFPDLLRGEARANAELKAVTKAKRRATLSICGLGWLDETEVDSIPGARKPKPPAANVMTSETTVSQWNRGHAYSATVDPETGEITEPPPDAASGDADQPASVQQNPTEAGEVMGLESMAREAAMRGEETFRKFYRLRSGAEQARINKIGDELRELMKAAET